MSLQEQVDKLRQMNLFYEARDCYDKYGFFFTDSYSLVDTFTWALAKATSSVDWNVIHNSLLKSLTKNSRYTSEEIFEAFYPKELYPEKYI